MIKDPYVRKDCVHYITGESDRWECSAGKEVCQCHGKHLVSGRCVYYKEKGKKK